MMLWTIIFCGTYRLVTLTWSWKPLSCMLSKNYIIFKFVILLIWRFFMVYLFLLLGKFVLNWSNHYIHGAWKHSRLNTLWIKTSTTYIAVLILTLTSYCATPYSHTAIRILKCRNRLIEAELRRVIKVWSCNWTFLESSSLLDLLLN